MQRHVPTRKPAVAGVAIAALLSLPGAAGATPAAGVDALASHFDSRKRAVLS